MVEFRIRFPGIEAYARVCKNAMVCG